MKTAQHYAKILDRVKNSDITTIGDEEQFLSSDYPKSQSLINTIYGQVLCSHFAFRPQREKMDNSNILDYYKIIDEQSFNNN